MKKITSALILLNVFGNTNAFSNTADEDTVIANIENLNINEKTSKLNISGKFKITRNSFDIIGENATYDKKNKTFDFKKSPYIVKNGIRLNSESIKYNDFKKELIATNVIKRYKGNINNSDSNNDSILFKNNYFKTNLLINNENGFIAKNIEYSTCSCENVDDKIWLISAKEINSETGEKPIELKDLAFKIKGLTVLKLPYILLPPPGVDRFEGWLFPKFGQTSDRGFWVENKYYQILGERSDITYGVLNSTKYGTKLSNEYRKNTDSTRLKTYISSTTKENDDSISPAFIDIQYAKYMNDRYKFQTNLIGTNDEKYMKEFYDDEYDFKSFLKSDIKLSRIRRNSSYADINLSAYKNITSETENEIKFSPNANYNDTINFKQIGTKINIISNIKTIDQVNDDDYVISTAYLKTRKQIKINNVDIKLDTSLLLNNIEYDFLYTKNINGTSYRKGSEFRTSPAISAVIEKPIYKFGENSLKQINFKAGYFIKKLNNNPEYLVNRTNLSQNYDNSTLFAHRFLYSDNIIDDTSRYAYGVEYNKTSNKTNTILFFGRNKNIRSHISSKYIIDMSKTFKNSKNTYNISSNSEHDENTFDPIIWNFSSSYSNNVDTFGLGYYASQKNYNNILSSAKVSTLTYKRKFSNAYDLTINLQNDHFINKGPLSRNIILNYNNECFVFTTNLKKTYNSSTGQVKNKKLLFTFEIKT